MSWIMSHDKMANLCFFLFCTFLVSSRSATTMESAVVHVRFLSVYTRPFHHGECVHTDRHSCGPAPSHTQSVRVSILIATSKPLRIGSYSLLKGKTNFRRLYVCDIIESNSYDERHACN